MASTYPTTKDNFTNPLATDDVSVVNHAQQHSDDNDAIEALEEKLGTTAQSGTEGSVIFVDSSGSLRQDNANLFYDVVTKVLRVVGGIYIGAGQAYTGAGAITLSSGANGNISLDPNGTGKIIASLDSTTTGNFQINRSGTTSGNITDDTLFINRTLITGGVHAISGTALQITSNNALTGGGSDTGIILGLTQSLSTSSGAILNISGAGTGNVINATTTNSSGNGILGQISSSSQSQYGLKILTNGGSTNALYVGGDGFIGMGTTAPSACLSILSAVPSFRLEGTNGVATAVDYGLFQNEGAPRTHGIYINILATSSDFEFVTRKNYADNIRFRIKNDTGNIAIGDITPTAILHIKPGTTGAGTAPFKLTSGTVMTTAEAGAIEFTTDDLFFTITTGAARKAFILDDGARLTNGKVPIATTNGRLIDSVVDNTSDVNKPISTATQTALDAKKTDSMSTNKLLGRGTGGVGVIEEITLGTNLSLAGTTLNATSGGSPPWGTITGTLSNQTDLQTALDGKVDENGAITGATKTKITYDTKGLVTAGADATTADIADSADKRYVTDAQRTVIQNTSGTNTGDQTISDATISTTDITTNNVSSAKHGFAPKSPADATKFLNGDTTPAYSQVKDSDLSTSDITTNDVSTSKHGFAPKVTDTAKFLRGDGTWANPTVTEAEIDVGSTPVSEASISVTDAAVSTSSKIIGGVAYAAPTGKDLDELEMDALEIKFEPGTGSFNLIIKGLEGYIADKFKIWYLVS